MLASSDRKKILDNFCKEHGLKFKDTELLNMAFCHTSYIHETNEDRIKSYERLEFLGDAVLKLAISDILYKRHEDYLEGKLTERRAVVVADKTIATFAKKIGLDKLILTGKCEQKEEIKSSIMACAFEAFLGAIYLEYKEKGYNKGLEFLIKNFEDEILTLNCTNPKAELQELTQKINHDLPTYSIMKEEGPAHKKSFTVGVYYKGELLGKGIASNKKDAEFIAAEQALNKLKKSCEEE